MARMSFSASGHTDSGDAPEEWGPLPEGEYRARITESDVKPNSKGTGSYVEFVWTVEGGEHDGKRIWDRITHEHTNPMAVDIGLKMLVTLARVVGVPKWEDTMELHGKQALVSVTVRSYTRRDGSEGWSNDVKGYKSLASTPPPEGTPVERPFGDDDIPF